MLLTATITCSSCGHSAPETMPTDRCLYFYECQNCRVILRPKPGDCCVFCSYGSQLCPFGGEAGEAITHREIN